jgi:hypothetical protein
VAGSSEAPAEAQPRHAAGCAVGRGVSVGLDVEEVGRRPRNMLRLAKRRFTPAEYDLLAGANASALGFLEFHGSGGVGDTR